MLTRLLGTSDGVEEDANEPLQGVLVHGVNVGEVCGTEEQELCTHCHWNVLATGGVNLLFCLLCIQHFGLEGREREDEIILYT